VLIDRLANGVDVSLVGDDLAFEHHRVAMELGPIATAGGVFHRSRFLLASMSHNMFVCARVLCFTWNPYHTVAKRGFSDFFR